jgi:HEAT repeat protein
VSGSAPSVDNRSSLSTEKTTSKKKPGSHDLTAVEGALQLLARAVRQFHTYPSTSPMCIDAVMACHEALQSIQHRDRFSSRVGPHDLIIDDTHIGAGTVVEHELTRRLFKLRVAAIEIECTATPRDLSRFCIDLVESEDPQLAEVTFAERLAEHGVGAILPEMAQRPVVMDVGVPAAHTTDLLTHERRRQAELTQPDTPVSYLYPPDRGWIRSDPSQTSLSQVSLLDLVVLVDDPADIAMMLVRLTDDEVTGPDAKQTALERKYSDVTRLFSALDARLAHVMFGKLARAVLNLEPDRRNNLLQRTILPGLLDGDANGKVLRDFPDMDLAESICLLLDLETAAPEVLSAALNRLDLTTERRAALVPLIEERMRRGRGGPSDDMSLGSSGVERHARELIKVDSSRETDFSEFAAFDLSIDAQAETTIADVRQGIETTDITLVQLLCASHLVRIERNPTLVESFVRRGLDMLGTLERAGRWTDLISALKEYRRLAEELRPRRPDVTDVISKALSDYCTPARLLSLATLHERDDEGGTIAREMLTALGSTMAAGLIELMNRSAHELKARALVPLICEMAATIAPALIAELDSCGPAATRVVAKALGHAGPGYEAALGRMAEHNDSQVIREAMRALARIGTPTAAVLVARHVRESRSDRHTAAEDALWHLPPAQTATQVRELLRSREFVLSHPQTAARLIDRAVQSHVQGLDDALTKLERLRFRFWKPSLVQVALKAREHRAR